MVCFKSFLVDNCCLIFQKHLNLLREVFLFLSDNFYVSVKHWTWCLWVETSSVFIGDYFGRTCRSVFSPDIAAALTAAVHFRLCHLLPYWPFLLCPVLLRLGTAQQSMRSLEGLTTWRNCFLELLTVCVHGFLIPMSNVSSQWIWNSTFSFLVC